MATKAVWKEKLVDVDLTFETFKVLWETGCIESISIRPSKKFVAIMKMAIPVPPQRKRGKR